MVKHAASFTPVELSRREKRDLQREINRARQEQRPARTSRRDRGFPEAAVPGPFGPGLINGGYWNLAKAWIPAHQATSQHIAGIYPFVADSGLGHRGPQARKDKSGDNPLPRRASEAIHGSPSRSRGTRRPDERRSHQNSLGAGAVPAA